MQTTVTGGIPLSRLEVLSAAGVSAVLFAVYLTTLCPTVSFIDAGELAAVAVTLGVAHPTGYPLFTLLGRLTSMLPLGGEEILRLNILAALLTSLAGGGVFLVAQTFAKHSRVFAIGSRSGFSSEARLAGTVIGALVVGLSTTFWSQSVAIEVYALHLLLLVAVILAFILGLEEQLSNGGTTSRFLLLFALLLGFSFANHMTTLLLAPAVLYLYFGVLGFGRASFLRLRSLAVFFLLGLSVYLYLPLRAWAQPPLVWGNPVTFERFLWHVSGRQYRSWMFTSVEHATRQFEYFVRNLTDEFHPLALAVALIGAIVLFRASRRLFLFLVLLLVTCIAYAVNYDIHDIEAYFLLAYLALGWFVVAGIPTLTRWLSRWFSPGISRYAVMFLLILPILQWRGNRERVDQSDNYLVADYTRTILQSLPPSAVVFTYQWDYFVSASYYAQFVKGERTDVTVVDKELFRRSWYFPMIERHAPWLMERSRTAVDAFLVELYKFEHNLPYNPVVIEARFTAMLNAFIENAMSDRPVYVGPEIEPHIGSRFRRVPDGYLYRLVGEREEPLSSEPMIVYRPTGHDSKYARGLRLVAARMSTATAEHLRSENKSSEALMWVAHALRIDSTFTPALALHSELNTRREMTGDR